jgi:hypothetical protein
MGRFDKPWEDPKNPIVAARPSAKYPGGTVYFFADGSRTETAMKTIMRESRR